MTNTHVINECTKLYHSY